MATAFVGPTAARVFALVAHRGQVDKAGRPYSEHVTRVADAVTGADAKTVAWLHDVVEDTGCTLNSLTAAGFRPAIVAAVDAITRRRREPATAYYARVRANPLALRVKLADVADNLDPARLDLLEPALRLRLLAKYAHALEELGS